MKWIDNLIYTLLSACLLAGCEALDLRVESIAFLLEFLEFRCHSLTTPLIAAFS